MHSYQQGRRGIRPASSRPRPLPPGMGTALCKFYPSGACTRGESCLYRHTTSPDKKSSAAGKNLAAHRYVQHPQTAGAVPSTPSPSRRGVTAPPIPSGGRGRAHVPAQLTPIIKQPSTSRGDGGHGQTAAGTSSYGAVKDDGSSARKSFQTSSTPKLGGNGKKSSSRRSTSPVKKYRRGLNKAFGTAAAGGGQPDMSRWATASGQPNMDMDDKIGRDNVPSRPSDEDLTKPVAVQGGIPTATNTNTNATAGTTNTNTNVGDEMTMIRADDQEGVTVVGDYPSADGHNGTNHDDNGVPQAPTFNPKPSSKGNRDDDEDEGDEEEQQDDFLAQYWHENIQMSIFTHEDVAEILKKSGKVGRDMHSSFQCEKAHKQPIPDDDARSNSKDGVTSINVDNNVSNQGTGEPVGDEGADKNGIDKGDVTDATGGTGTAEQEDDAKDDQGANINKNKAIVERYDVDNVDPKRESCRCFCPPEVAWAKIDLPCPNFDNCPVLCCPYEHKTKESFEKRMAERGLSMDDLVLGVHDEKSHIPDDYNGEEGRVPPRVEVDIVNVLCKITSPSCVYTYPPSSGDTIVLCQPISSADTYAEGTTTLATSSDVEGDEINTSDCVADLYCYDEDGEFQFLVPPSIPNETRTKEILLFEDSEAYSRESFDRSWNYKMKPKCYWSEDPCSGGRQSCRHEDCRFIHVTRKQWIQGKTADWTEANGPTEQVDSDADAMEKQDELNLPGEEEPESKVNICNHAADSEDPSVNAGVDVVDPLSNKRKSSRTLAHRKGGRKPKEGKKTKKFSTVVSDKRSPFKQPQQSKTGTKLNPSATEFVPSTPTSTTRTAVVHVDVEGGKRPICTPAGKSDANSTPARNLSFGTPSDGNGEASSSRSETKDDQMLSNDMETGTTRANTMDSISIPVLSENSKGTGSKIPAQIDTRATRTGECPTEALVSNVKTSTAAPNVMEKNSGPTPTDDAANTDDTNAASEDAVLSIPQDKDVPEPSRERSGAFDLSRNVSPPAPSWSSPTRFQGTDKEVMVAIRKSDRELNFLAAMKSKPKKPDHPECDLPTSTTCASTPATPHDKKKKKPGDTPSSKLGVSQGNKCSHQNQTKITNDKKNAADTIVSQEPTSQPKSESKPKSKSSNSIRKKVKTTTMATPAAASVSSDSFSGPSNSSSSNNSTDAIHAEPSVDNCVKRMEEMQFSSSVISQTEAEFNSKEPGTWTKEDLFSLACCLAKQEELNNAALEEHSLNEQNDTSLGRPVSHAKMEGGVEETKDIDPEDDPENQTVDEKKGAKKKSKAAAKNKRRRKNKAKKSSESKAKTTTSETATTPSEGGEGTRKKNGQDIPKKEAEKPMEQDSKTPTSLELLKPTDSGDRIDQSVTEPSPESKKRFRFWSAEQFHRDLYTKNLFKLISCEYSRLQHCENPKDTSSNDVLVEAFMNECTRVYEKLYKYRTGAKSTLMVADDHPTLAGRSGRIVASDLAKHEFEVEFHRSKTEKIVNKTNTMSEVNDDDTYDLLDVDTDASSSFTRLKISAYDLAIPEIASGKSKGRSNKKAKNNKSAAQLLRPAQCALKIEEDEAHDIHGFGMVVRASTLNELAGLKDSEILEHRLSEIMQERDEQEEAAKALEEQKEQAKIREAEEQEKQEILNRFQQYEREIKGRRKKARRILSSGKSKLVKALKTKPEDLYDNSDDLHTSINNGLIDVLVILHECEDDQEAHDLLVAIREAEFSPTSVEYDESSETARTCFLLKDDNHKIPLCVVDHKLDMSDFSRILPAMKEDFDSLVRTIMEPVQFDELCSETGLRKSDALMFVHTLIRIEEDSPSNMEIPLHVVKHLVKSDLLDKGFVKKVLSRDEGEPDQNQLILRAASQRLSKRLSFDLSGLVHEIANKVKVFDRERVSDSDQDSDSIERGTNHMRRLSDCIDSSVFEKFCKVTGLNESDALLFVADYLVFMHGREALAPELDKPPERFLGNLVRSGFFDQDFVTKVADTNGGFMSSEMFFTLVNYILETRFMFSLSDLVLVDLARLFDFGIADSQAECHRALDVSEESELQLDGESIFFIEELPSDEKVTEADDETYEDEPDEDSNTDDNIGDDEDDTDDDDGDDDETDVASNVDINEEEDIDDDVGDGDGDELTDAGNGNDDESSEYFVSSTQSEAAV